MATNHPLQRLMAIFVTELEEHVRGLERGLLALERDPTLAENGELLGTLFRTAHSLKGAAGSVKAGLVEVAGHRMEEAIAAARDGRMALDAKFFELMLSMVDAIDEAGKRLRTGNNLDGAPLEGILRRLTEGLAACAGQMPPAQKPAAAQLRAPATMTEPALAADLWRGTVRVPADKLDALVAHSGELLLVRHRINVHAADAATLLKIAGDCHVAWQRVVRGFGEMRKRQPAADATPAMVGAGQAPPIGRHLDKAIEQSQDAVWRLESRLHRLVSDLDLDRKLLEQAAGPLDTDVRRTRMVPFVESCEGLERMVRDLTAQGDKRASLIVEGGDIEIDRSVLEQLKDPLLHLVRNAIDHGIESMAVRRAAGKPEVGRVAVAATLRGHRMEVTVTDDGRGVNLDAVREQLSRRNLPIPESDTALARQIFIAGLSTSPAVTHLSGRGVGLDVVKSRLDAIRGLVDVSFVPGQGTRFGLSVPLTMTTIRAVLVECGGQVFAIDTANIKYALRISLSEIRSVENRATLLLASGPVPVVDLAHLLGLSERSLDVRADKQPGLALQLGDRTVAFLVESLQDEREVVVRSLGPRLSQSNYATGGTVLPDGRIALILNSTFLLERALNSATVKTPPSSATTGERGDKKQLLVVDDSITVRALQKSILESAGYDVVAAADGAEAWQLLLERGADLVVSDVEMPRMNGFALTEVIRGSRRFRDLPVILVTALESEADKARGLAVGADAYLVKSAFDQQELLAAIARML